jgi:hypothetical protein
LAVFAGGFTLQDASAVAADDEIAASEVVDCVANLVTKSLVATDISRDIIRYRLLDTTRVYSLEKLRENGGEPEWVARCHAEYYRDLFQQAEIEWETRPTSDWLADYGRRIDDVRAALAWAFSPSGDASIGVMLTAASLTLWRHLSLFYECCDNAERALSALGQMSCRDPRSEMQLRSALAASLLCTKGAVLEVGAAWKSALNIADRLDDTEFQLRALSALFWYRLAVGEYRLALQLAERFCALAVIGADRDDQLIGDRMLAAARHHLGDQPSARGHIEHMLAGYVAPERRSHVIRFGRDQGLAARGLLARILWLQGFLDQAVLAAQGAVDEAEASDHTMSLCGILADAACPIALLSGDLVTAERYVRMLLDRSARHALAYWQAAGLASRPRWRSSPAMPISVCSFCAARLMSGGRPGAPSG